MNVLCVVDTCSLVYLRDTEFIRKQFHRWLWKEFEVRYSQAVWEEINRHLQKMGDTRSWLRRQGQRSRAELPAITTYERMLFAEPLSRKFRQSTCRVCNQTIWNKQTFEADLTSLEDQGERHNCCVALYAFTESSYSQIIFLTDDFRAVRDYADFVFQTFPMGQIWSSLDFAVHLFMKYRRRTSLNEILDVLRDINAKATTGLGTDEQIRRLRMYEKRVERIDQLLARIQR